MINKIQKIFIIILLLSLCSMLYINTVSANTVTVPTSIKVNREVRYSFDKSDKNNITIKLTDCKGISYIKLTTYTSKNKQLDEYILSSSDDCSKDKKFNNYISFKGYDEKTNMATITINKNYFIKNSYNKNNKINVKIVTKDTTGLLGKEKVYMTLKDSSWNVNRGVRASTSTYKDGVLSIRLKDFDGLTTGKACFELTDVNRNLRILKIDSEDLSKNLSNKVTRNNKIVEGIYKLNIGDLKLDDNKCYNIQVKSTDALGHARLESIKIKAINLTNKDVTGTAIKTTSNTNTTKSSNTSKSSKTTKTTAKSSTNKTKTTSNSSTGNAKTDEFLKDLNFYLKKIDSSWIYSNQSTTIANKRANCAITVNWALRKMGILNSNQKLYVSKQNNIKNESVLKNHGLKCVYKGKSTMKNLVNNNKLKKGDIVFWYKTSHTNVYAGNEKWYDSGSSGTNRSTRHYNKDVSKPRKVSYLNNGSQKIYAVYRFK